MGLRLFCIALKLKLMNKFLYYLLLNVTDVRGYKVVPHILTFISLDRGTLVSLTIFLHHSQASPVDSLANTLIFFAFAGIGITVLK